MPGYSPIGSQCNLSHQPPMKRPSRRSLWKQQMNSWKSRSKQPKNHHAPSPVNHTHQCVVHLPQAPRSGGEVHYRECHKPTNYLAKHSYKHAPDPTPVISPSVDDKLDWDKKNEQPSMFEDPYNIYEDQNKLEIKKKWVWSCQWRWNVCWWLTGTRYYNHQSTWIWHQQLQFWLYAEAGQHSAIGGVQMPPLSWYWHKNQLFWWLCSCQLGETKFKPSESTTKWNLKNSPKMVV